MILGISLSNVAALLAMVFGTAGLVLGILSYLRDRAQVKVILQWDMRVTQNPLYDTGKAWAIIGVANVGRRPIFISKAAICLPKRYKPRYLISRDCLSGKKLNEGDPEVNYVVDQSGCEKYAKDWKKIRAVVFDAAGKKYYSKADPNKIPSWAKTE